MTATRTPQVPKQERDRSVQGRWGELLTSAGFAPVPSYFLRLYHKLQVCSGKRARPMNSTEAMIIIHLSDFKWDERDPWPSVGTIAERLGISVRSTREAMSTLEKAGLLTRKLSNRGETNRYNFKGLIVKLEEEVLKEAINKLNDAHEDEEEEATNNPPRKKERSR